MTEYCVVVAVTVAAVTVEVLVWVVVDAVMVEVGALDVVVDAEAFHRSQQAHSRG